MPKDFLGRDIHVGSHVVFAQLGYRNFLKGKIVKLTPKTALVEHKATNGCTGLRQTKQFHTQLIRIGDEDI